MKILYYNKKFYNYGYYISAEICAQAVSWTAQKHAELSGFLFSFFIFVIFCFFVIIGIEIKANSKVH